uniref:Amine oxidase domain-containing protein n=1 Tax=Terrapene triunguis TaxID=2587831 RepID=A0A674JKZ8_9SAUR
MGQSGAGWCSFPAPNGGWAGPHQAPRMFLHALLEGACPTVWGPLPYGVFSANESRMPSLTLYLYRNSRGAIDMIGDVLNMDGSFHLSFLDSLMADTLSFFYRHLLPTPCLSFRFDEITGGFDQLPEAFYKSMHRDIQFQSTVAKILHDNEKVRVFYHRPLTRLLSSVTADYVLVATTAKAVRLIKFSPPLSSNKTHALRSLHYSQAVKIFLACREKFWEKDGIYNGRSITDRPSRFIYYPGHNFSSGVGVILASYTWDNDAEFFIPLSDEKCVDLVQEDLAEIHQLPKTYIRNVCDKHVIKKWGLDKYAMGAYVSLTPYQLVDYSKALFQNEGRVYFAGEYTAHPHAWIETAMKAAMRAARSIHGAVNASPSELGWGGVVRGLIPSPSHFPLVLLA